ncbi:MAG: CBS domain-containing protein [Kofleriaceae bacterium]|nr:CBS domain-containing protein [Kofleriaceae bacterium]
MASAGRPRRRARPPQTAHPGDSVTEVAGAPGCRRRRDGALPVVERGHLIGLVTAADILGAEVHRSIAARAADARDRRRPS